MPHCSQIKIVLQISYLGFISLLHTIFHTNQTIAVNVTLFLVSSTLSNLKTVFNYVSSWNLKINKEKYANLA